MLTRGISVPAVMLPMPDVMVTNFGAGLSRSSEYAAWNKTRGPFVLTSTCLSTSSGGSSSAGLKQSLMPAFAMTTSNLRRRA